MTRRRVPSVPLEVLICRRGPAKHSQPLRNVESFRSVYFRLCVDFASCRSSCWRIRFASAPKPLRSTASGLRTKPPASKSLRRGSTLRSLRCPTAGHGRSSGSLWSRGTPFSTTTHSRYPQHIRGASSSSSATAPESLWRRLRCPSTATTAGLWRRKSLWGTGSSTNGASNASEPF